MKPAPEPAPASTADRDATPVSLSPKFRLPDNCRIATPEEAGRTFGFVGATNFVKAARRAVKKRNRNVSGKRWAMSDSALTFSAQVKGSASRGVGNADGAHHGRQRSSGRTRLQS
jgi:hypothetical protein